MKNIVNLEKNNYNILIIKIIKMSSVLEIKEFMKEQNKVPEDVLLIQAKHYQLLGAHERLKIKNNVDEDEIYASQDNIYRTFIKDINSKKIKNINQILSITNAPFGMKTFKKF